MKVGEFFAAYGLFVAQTLTIFVLLGLVVVLIAAIRRETSSSQGLTLRKLNDEYDEVEAAVTRVTLGKDRFKKASKAKKKERKKAAKALPEQQRQKVFVVDFKGDLRATAVSSLRKEIDAILSAANESDVVLLRLENSGGTVHEHGFAASQLLRLKARGIRLVVAVDRVAASGGYLMACVADHLMAAPFAIIGSIGVLAQLPNFHRYLETRGVDFEQITAGKFKRTVTMFGENTEEGRQKLREELDDVHNLFKTEIVAHRPDVDIEVVATGEHWYGSRALELRLVDELRTSDEYLLEMMTNADVYSVSYKRHRTLPERLLGATESLLYRH